MTDKTDVLIARRWAEENINALTPTPMTPDQRNAVAAHILATTAPERPAWVSTKEDYENAPTGTIVAGDYADPWVKDYMGFWLACSAGESETSQEMALAARRVLRRGETL